MYTIYLKEEDMLEEKHFPVVALINEAFNVSPAEFIHNVVNETGSGYNYASCAFWSELDEYERTQTSEYDGIMVNTEDGEEVIVSLEALHHYLSLAVDRLPDSPEVDKEQLKSEIERLHMN